MPRFIDLTGKRFGRLTVIERAETKGGKTRWKSQCDCGKITYTISHRLLSGQTQSCGCMRDLGIKHGMTNTRLFKIWEGMKSRCLNPNKKCYDRYGGRGISVCQEWQKSFESFRDWSLENGYTEGLTIDRIDVNGDYCPENCKWSTPCEQALNKRNTIYIEHNGERKPLPVWCRQYNFKYSIASQRYRNMVKHGKPIEFEKLFFNGNLSVKRIDQFSMDGTYIKTWEKLSDATKAGYDHAGISACCNGKRKSANGFIWRFSK